MTSSPKHQADGDRGAPTPDTLPDRADRPASGTGAPPGQPVPLWFVWVIRLAVAGAIVWAGCMVYAWLMANKPKRARRPRDERVVTVETKALERVSQQITIATTGTVVPVRELSLMPRVSGEVVEVSSDLEPGGTLAAGTVAVKIDPTDFRLQLRQAEATLATARNACSAADVQLATSRSRLVQSQAQLTQSHAQATQAEASLVQARAQVVTAEYNHAVERGRQDVAKHEWTLVEDRENTTELERELTLRKPHLRKAEADAEAAKAGVRGAQGAVDSALGGVESAKAAVVIAEATIEADALALESAKSAVTSTEAALEKAKLDLARTEVVVPFNAVVVDRTVTVGAQVGSQTRLAGLVDADAFWIEVALPLDRTPWVTIPADGKPGAAAVVRHSGALAGRAEWRGTVARRLPRLEPNGRQVRLLVEVRNPLVAADGLPPLLLGSFVTVDLAGPTLDNVFVLPRVCIHNGNEVWLRNGEKRLEVRTVDILWSDAQSAVVETGLEAGEQLVISDVASPIPGMQIALPGESPARGGPSGKAGGGPGGKGEGAGQTGKRGPGAGAPGRGPAK